MYCSILHRITTNNAASTTEIESNQKTNSIAFGDSSGYLEIIDLNKMETKSDSVPQSKEDSFVHQRRTTFQVLAFHKMPINRLMWNPNFDKIVTVDESNSLVVWNKTENDLYNSQMVNNRGVSRIVDVRWSKSGRDISFLYEDGHIYSGTVEGKNTWFNNFEEETRFIEYSPNDDKILISKKKEKIFVLESSGKQIGEINLFENIKNFEIANISWWGKNTGNNSEGDSVRKKHLMIAFKNGVIILVDDETDENPVDKDTKEGDLEIGKNRDRRDEINSKSDKINNKSERSGMIENNNIDNENNNKSEKSGMIENNNIDNESNNKEKDKEKDGMNENNNKNINIVNESILNNTNININNKSKSILLFYNVKGELLKRFVCPCHVNSFSWGYSSTVALAADKYIYIALTKFKHKWTYLNDTIVFGYLISDQKYNLIFLNTTNDTKQCKLVYNLIDVISSDFYCAIIQETKEKKEYSFMITNNFCNVLDTKLVPIKPLYYAMNNQFIVICDSNYVYVF